MPHTTAQSDSTLTSGHAPRDSNKSLLTRQPQHQRHTETPESINKVSGCLAPIGKQAYISQSL